MRKDGPAQPQPYPAEKARGGEIILRTPLRRAIFLGGLAASVLLVLILGVWALTTTS
jgi:hypothetical protein